MPADNRQIYTLMINTVFEYGYLLHKLVNSDFKWIPTSQLNGRGPLMDTTSLMDTYFIIYRANSVPFGWHRNW